MDNLTATPGQLAQIAEDTYRLSIETFSDELLAAEIVLAENVIFQGDPSPVTARRYANLVAHRQHRLVLKGRAQARRLQAVEKMLEELALLEPGGAERESGCSFEVDDVVRGDEGEIVAVYGTKVSTWIPGKHSPYILGEV
jgi:hypothetical protein